MQTCSCILLRQTAATMDDPETRGGGGGYGHSSGHGHGYGAITLDPVSIISLLALGNSTVHQITCFLSLTDFLKISIFTGAFLINNILQLLRANAPAPAPPAGGGGGRSIGPNIPESILSALADNESVHYNLT